MSVSPLQYLCLYSTEYISSKKLVLAFARIAKSKRTFLLFNQLEQLLYPALKAISDWFPWSFRISKSEGEVTVSWSTLFVSSGLIEKIDSVKDKIFQSLSMMDMLSDLISNILNPFHNTLIQYYYLKSPAIVWLMDWWELEGNWTISGDGNLIQTTFLGTRS